MSRRAMAEYIALALIWGFSFLLLVKVIAAFGWIGAVSFRGFTAAAVLTVAAFLVRRPLEFRGSWGRLAVVGATTVSGQLICLSYATPRIGTAMAAIIVATIPLFSMTIGHVLGIEHMHQLGVVGIMLGVVGIVMLVGFPQHELTGEFLFGSMVSLLGALSAAVGSLYARAKLGDIGAWEQTIGAFMFGGLFAFPLLLAVPVPTSPSLIDFVYLVALAGICSAAAYAMYFSLVAEAGATIAVSVEFLVTIVAVAVGAGLLHERLSAIQIAGAIVIVAGCVLVLDLLPQRSRATRIS